MLSNFILIPSCCTLLLSWICIELFYYKRNLKEIHTLSRHTIIHQQTGWYHVFINLLWFFITISIFLKIKPVKEAKKQGETTLAKWNRMEKQNGRYKIRL
jgi:hypothetical protein